jgi:hypothetical protein
LQLACPHKSSRSRYKYPPPPRTPERGSVRRVNEGYFLKLKSRSRPKTGKLEHACDSPALCEACG